MSEHFSSACAAFGLEATQIRQLERYRDLLVERAGQFNLTSIRDAAGIERRHLLEALALGDLLKRLDLLSPARPRWLDIGSGAGLPGLPLKVAFPWIELTLLETNGKKCDFLREAIGLLGLDGVAVAEGRAETLAHDPTHRETYDAVIARAVAPLPVLVEYALPFLKTGGRLVAQKGSAAERELTGAQPALRRLAAAVATVADFTPPEGLAQKLVIVRKDGPTPPELPRRAGLPSKRPLS